MDDYRTDVVLYTQGWTYYEPAVDQPPITMVKGRLFINGNEIPGAISTRILVSRDDFLTLSVRLSASTLRIVPLQDIGDIDSVLPEVDLPTEP